MKGRTLPRALRLTNRKVLSTPSVASLPCGSSVALGSAPLMRHKMTFSHFSKNLIRPLSQGDSLLARCEYIHSIPEIAEHPLSPPETGVSTTQWGGGG